MTKVLVTGAGGYLGVHVVRALADLGIEVVALHRGNKQIDPRAKELVCDFSDLDCLKLAATNLPDVVLHLAWSDGFNHNAPSHIDNLPHHVRFVRTLMEAGVRHFAGLGTMHEVGYWEGRIDDATPNAPRSMYGIAKNAFREAAKIEVDRAAGTFQWLRAYYILGDDKRNQSLFSKILSWDSEGRKTFPFTSGSNQYDFIDVGNLARQIAFACLQVETCGVIDCCSGAPVSLRDKVEAFIVENRLAIRPEYGAFPDRPYDSPAIWGDAQKIRRIMMSAENLTTKSG